MALLSPFCLTHVLGPAPFREKAQEEVDVKSKTAASERKAKQRQFLEEQAKMYGVTRGHRLGDTVYVGIVGVGV